MTPDPRPARIDALRDAPRTRFRSFRGQVLDDGPDPVLQEIVAELAAATRQPMAAVVLVLERTLRFRASFGLPADLEAAGGVDRSVSLCQFVVRDDAPFVVEDCALQSDIPTAAVSRGFARYVGVPIRIDGEVVGSLCVTGDVPSPVDAGEVALLEHLADRVSQRLRELAGPPSADLLRASSASLFGELRNALTGVVGAGEALRFVAADLDPVHRAVRARAWSALPLLDDAVAAIEELGALARDLTAGASRVKIGVCLLEHAVAADHQPVPLAEVCERAVGFVEHLTKTRGGVRVGSRPPHVVHVPGIVGNVLATAIGAVAAFVVDGVDVDIVAVAGGVRFEVRGALSDAQARDCVAGLSRLVGIGVPVSLAAATDGAVIVFADLLPPPAVLPLHHAHLELGRSAQ